VRVDQLLTMQRELLAALQQPLRGPSRDRTALPPRSDDAIAAERFAATAQAWLTPSATLRESARLELYHRQYWYRLLDSLAEDFPTVKLVIGASAFWRLLETYLEAQPPSAYSLRQLGAGLPGFVASYPGPLPHRDHVRDVAALEWAWLEAFDAAEHAPVPAEELASRALALQPHLTVLACRTPADALWRRAIEERPRGRLTAVSDAPTRFVAVFRDGELRDVERLHPAAHAILAAVAADGSLERALDAAAPLLPARRGAQLVHQWFQRWVQLRWFCAR
jgi:Putative DNA-binding domain